MTSTMTTDVPNREITPEMAQRIRAGRLDYRQGIGWHDPRGYNPEASRRIDAALSLTRRVSQ